MPSCFCGSTVAWLAAKVGEPRICEDTAFWWRRRGLGDGEPCSGSGLSVGSLAGSCVAGGVNGEAEGRRGAEDVAAGLFGSSPPVLSIELLALFLPLPSSLDVTAFSSSPRGNSPLFSVSPTGSTRVCTLPLSLECWLSSWDSSSSSSESWTNPFCRHLDIGPDRHCGACCVRRRGAWWQLRVYSLGRRVD